VSATQVPHLTGSFNSAGSPTLKISIYGVLEEAKKEFEAVVDTGFSGFLSMPIVEAFPLALVLTGTTTTILADGSQSFKFTALGHVKIADQDEAGVILLNTGPSDVLGGMEFLRVFKRTLILSHQGFVLMDTEAMQKAFRALSEFVEDGVLPESDSPGSVPEPPQTPPTTDN
jgi:predicted aspartyl protease